MRPNKGPFHDWLGKPKGVSTSFKERRMERWEGKVAERIERRVLGQGVGVTLPLLGDLLWPGTDMISVLLSFLCVINEVIHNKYS